MGGRLRVSFVIALLCYRMKNEADCKREPSESRTIDRLVRTLARLVLQCVANNRSEVHSVVLKPLPISQLVLTHEGSDENEMSVLDR